MARLRFKNNIKEEEAPKPDLSELKRDDHSPKRRRQKFQKLLRRVSLGAGIAAVGTSFGPISYWLSTTNVNPAVSNISDQLGSHPYLRVGIAATGLLGAAFGHGLEESLPESTSFGIESKMFTLSSLAVTGAAILIPPSPVHKILAGGYFVGADITIALLAGNMLANGSKAAGTFTATAAGAALATLAYEAIKYKLKIPANGEIAMSAINALWIMGIASYALVKNKIVARREKKQAAIAG